MKVTYWIILFFMGIYNIEGSWDGTEFNQGEKGKGTDYNADSAETRTSASGLILDKHGRIKMGGENPECDDAKRGLDIDLSDQEKHMTCKKDEKIISLAKKVNNFPLNWRHSEQQINCIPIPTEYSPQHFCINDTITYPRMNRLPRYGPHRPIWGTFGEYKYMPPQRWLHNVEHGSVILLYHPCVNKKKLKRVKELVTGCIRKHIITPTRLVLPTAPIALVTWSCSLEMIAMDDELVKTFIKQHGLNGPEGHLSKQGKYKHLLIKEAKIPRGSDINDTVLCPQHKDHSGDNSGYNSGYNSE